MTADDPIEQFIGLLDRARAACLDDPTAMTLATAGATGRPSCRVVLLKGVDERGFVFYTNLESRKARELRANPNAALCIYWSPLDKQVRVEGPVEPVSDAEADAYFASRPREYQIGAWASTQSATLASREELDRRFRLLQERFDGLPVPRPPFWSGYRVIPHQIEFWTLSASRLHDRVLYTRHGRSWERSLLFP